MTERIQQKVEQITAKVTVMQQNLFSAAENNRRLSSEIESLNATIEALKIQMKQKEEELKGLSEKMLQAKEQNAPSLNMEKSKDSNRENEINELVKEIEYCISQLKK